jgi:hypothetical protein
MPVYLVRLGPAGQVKIGFASNITSRLVVMQVAAPEKLVLLRILDGGKELEAALHSRFASHRVRGEWFTFCDEMLDDLGASDLTIDARRRRRGGWTWGPDARARQAEAQRKSFDDPVIGALRRQRQKQTVMRRSAANWRIQDIAVRAGGFRSLALLLNEPLVEVFGWERIPAKHAATISDTIGVAAEYFAHLIERDAA